MDDGGLPVGIEQDFPFLGRKQSVDGWDLWFTELMMNSLGKPAATDVTPSFGKLDGATVAHVEVVAAAQPVFVTPTKGERRPVFYVRFNGSTRELAGQDLLDYQRKRWPS